MIIIIIRIINSTIIDIIKFMMLGGEVGLGKDYLSKLGSRKRILENWNCQGSRNTVKSEFGPGDRKALGSTGFKSLLFEPNLTFNSAGRAGDQLLTGIPNSLVTLETDAHCFEGWQGRTREDISEEAADGQEIMACLVRHCSGCRSSQVGFEETQDMIVVYNF